MNAFEAATRVLSEADGPLHYTELTRRMIESGYWTKRRTGKTPDATVNAALSQDIAHHGDAARFRRTAPGFFALNLAPGTPSWLSPSLVLEIDEHNRAMRESLLKKIREGSPSDFEKLVAHLLEHMGFVDVVQTPISGDGGIDVRGTLIVSDVIHLRMAVQAKRWRGTVGAPIVRQVRGSLSPHEQGLIITTGTFSAEARADAQRQDASPVALVDGEQLAKLLARHELGVTRSKHDLLAPSDLSEKG